MHKCGPTSSLCSQLLGCWKDDKQTNYFLGQLITVDIRLLDNCECLNCISVDIQITIPYNKLMKPVLIADHQYLYPTYDIDQRYRQGNICDIALWLGQYHDIALWYS